MPLRYETRGADTFAGRTVARCPVCEFPMPNGFQLACEAGVCHFRDKALHYDGEQLRDILVKMRDADSVADRGSAAAA